VLAVVIVVVLATVFYLNPLGRKSFSFRTTDASAITVGQDVRVAGIGVGSVTAVSMEAESVVVEAEIDDSVLVGSDSRIEVRMLTPVGGYAITLIPLGEIPIGDRPIPMEQVQVPYSIGDVLQAAPHATDNIKGDTVDANLDEVARALGENSSSVGSVISGMTSIARIMDEQREQVRTVAALAAEYTQTVNANREFVFDLIRQIDIVLSTYNTTHVGFNEAYRLLGEVLMTLAPFESYYLEHKEEVLGAVNQAKSVIEDFQTTVGPTITNLETMRSQLADWLTPEGLATIAGGQLMASDICVPVPGRKC
jgi:phospholipid/cholesterol/gamma-HCH transport system substrate-binding protein